MSENTNIAWTDSTFNPWKICTPVSPGCANCYASALAKRMGWGAYRKGVPRIRTKTWNHPLKWNKKPWACDACGNSSVSPIQQGLLPCACGQACYHRRRVFCGSLCDWLDDEAPIEWLADLLKLIHDTPNLDWLLLTKRPENWSRRLRGVLDRNWENKRVLCDFHDWLARWHSRGVPPSNVWVGATVENQEMAEERIGQLILIPAVITFLSCEPLLSPIDFEGDISALTDWVIVGGESGPRRRPMELEWLTSIVDQCQNANVPVFVKQDCGRTPGLQGRIPDHIFNLKQFPRTTP